MTEKQFLDLLRRFEKGRCTPEEEARLQQWLDNMKEGPGPFKSLNEKERMRMTLRMTIYRQAGIAPASQRSTRIIPLVYRVAASILVLIAVSYGLWKYGAMDRNIRDRSATAEATSGDGIEKVLLPDGSVIWLKAGSRLVYPLAFDGMDRIVTLQGEALFEVAKDPDHPFVIHSGDITTTVLGTSFNIRNTSDHTEVFVLTGKVSVASGVTQETVELLPMQKALYTHASRQLTKEEGSAPVDYTKGTEYDMSFEDTRISEIAKRIEKKFNVTVKIEGDVGACVITADVTGLSLNNTLDMISEALNASYEIDDGHVTLKGDGCD